jgi:hypothetical protein
VDSSRIAVTPTRTQKYSICTYSDTPILAGLCRRQHSISQRSSHSTRCDLLTYPASIYLPFWSKPLFRGLLTSPPPPHSVAACSALPQAAGGPPYPFVPTSSITAIQGFSVVLSGHMLRGLAISASHFADLVIQSKRCLGRANRIFLVLNYPINTSRTLITLLSHATEV